jgi:hypothetical protein
MQPRTDLAEGTAHELFNQHTKNIIKEDAHQFSGLTPLPDHETGLHVALSTAGAAH